MKGSIIALGMVGEAEAAALVVDGKLDDLLIDAPDDVPAPGTIYRAICDRPIKGQGGMMVRLPEGSGYLRGAKGLRPGEPILVQVTGYAEAGKAVPVTDRVLFKSRYSIVTPEAPGLNISRAIKDDEQRLRLHDIATETMDGSEMGLILRSVSVEASDDDIAADIAGMRELAEAVMADTEGQAECLVDGAGAQLLSWRDWPKPDIMAESESAFDDYDIAGMIAEIQSPRVVLSGGAHMYVEPTRALVAVDVNTGADTSLAAGLKANIAAARDLPRQLRLRGLGGQITVDFAPLAKKDRRQIEQILRAAFRADGIETALVGWTPLGHFELQRKRERLPLPGLMR